VDTLDILEVTLVSGGGVIRHIADILSWLQDTGMRFKVAAPQESIAQLQSLKVHPALGFQRLASGNGFGPFTAAAQFGDLRRALGRRWDIVHAHSTKAGAVAAVVAETYRRPILVYTPHAVGLYHLNPAVRLVSALSERALARVAVKTVAVSRSEADALSHLYRGLMGNRLTVIENAVTIGERPHGARRFLAAHVGRPGAQKRGELAIRVFADVATTLPDGDFAIVGYGAEKEGRLQELAARLGVADRLYWLESSDARAVVATSKVTLNTSRYEGMSYVLLEAFAAESAVVATNVVGNRDAIDHGRTGLLAAADVTALSAATVHLLKDAAARQKITEQARSVAATRFSPLRFRDAYRRLYGSLAP
jgi:glycosyltransferase involved in cell wall biosynthesis